MRYIVLGMHKSGTTLMAQLLHHAGISMVKQTSSKSYDDGNYYERVASHQINIKLLNTDPDQMLLHAPPQVINTNKRVRQSMQQLVDKLDQENVDWGFKDPRTCLVYEAWREMLGDHKILVIFRSVHDIWHRYDYRGGKKIWRKLQNSIRLVQRWCEYNHAILKILKSTNMPNLTVSYPHLMTSKDDLQRIETFIGRSIDYEVDYTAQHRQQSQGLISFAIKIVRYHTGLDYEDIYHQLITYSTKTTH